GNLVSGYVFGRGSHVLEYWLTNAEGFAVRSGGSRLGVVRGVVIDPAGGRASALVVRSPLLHRRRTVLAREAAAVGPAAPPPAACATQTCTPRPAPTRPGMRRRCWGTRAQASSSASATVSRRWHPEITW